MPDAVDPQGVPEPPESERGERGPLEVINGGSLMRSYTDVLFDFDGTLSLIREGWPEVMVPMMVEFLSQTPSAESVDRLERIAYQFVMELNGKQTIYQMIRLAREVEARGGRALAPLEYKHIYHQRLMRRIDGRRQGLATGRIAADDLLVPGSRAMLSSLRNRGLRLYLASGTDECFVRQEVNLLHLNGYFEDRIYGAQDEHRTFSKEMVIERILQENEMGGELLLGFGDGYVEIKNVKAAGGTAVAVASDERSRSGRVNLWKRNRLVDVGADVVIPDYSCRSGLERILFGEPATEA